MFFAVAHRFPLERFVISDVNAELISVYRTIRNQVQPLMRELNSVQNHFNALPDQDSKSLFYYNLRESFNQTILENDHSAEQAALFIALSKLGFNGLYRVNAKGLYNVPFGRRKVANLYDESNLRAVSEILQKADIYCRSYEECLTDVNKKSLVYFDPPYRPLSNSSSFTSYSKSGFNDDEQKKLAKVARKVVEAGGTFFLSNSDPTQVDPNDLFFDQLYEDFDIRRIKTKRLLSAKASSRGEVSEILVIGQ